MRFYVLTVFFYYWWGGTKSLGTAATSGLLYKPQMIDEVDCGAVGGMKIDRGNRSTRRKPAPAPLCPPQIPHDPTRARTLGRRGGKSGTNRLSYCECCENDLECETVDGYQYLDEPAASTFFLENGDGRYHQNIGSYSLDYMMSHYRRL
jgi:hypothetical protein